MSEVYKKIVYYIILYYNKSIANEFNQEKNNFKVYNRFIYKKQNIPFEKEDIYYKFTLESFF